MPAIYAHRAFGKDAAALLERGALSEIAACPASFALGLHGPDALFYFHPLTKNAVNLHGEALHSQSAAPFFTAARDLYRQRGARAADKAYLLGFVCHFALDSACHAEVAAQMERTALSHTAVEAAFERWMLLRDGLVPERAHIAGHLRATRENISALAAYCSVTERQAKKCIRSMVRNSRLLRAPNAVKRALLCAALRLAGSRSVIDMIVPAADTPAAVGAAKVLGACYESALKKAAELMENYSAFLAGEAELDGRFSSNYESEELLCSNG